MELEMYGEVEISTYKKNSTTTEYIRRKAKGDLSDYEKSKMDNYLSHREINRNTLTDLFFDRFSGEYINSSMKSVYPTSSGDWISNHQPESWFNARYRKGFVHVLWPCGGLFTETTTYAFWDKSLMNQPGIIGLGHGGSLLPAARDNKGLMTPYEHVTDNWNYRNTYNSKEGGPRAGRSSNVLRCGTYWEDNFDPGVITDIDKIGLFQTQLFGRICCWEYDDPDTFIDFTNCACSDMCVPEGTGVDCQENYVPNRAWDVLTVVTWTGNLEGGLYWSCPPTGDLLFTSKLLVLNHCDTPGGCGTWTYKWSEPNQIITYTGPAADTPPVFTDPDAPDGAPAIVYYIPRYDHEGLEGDEIPTNPSNFLIPYDHTGSFGDYFGLYARIVLEDFFSFDPAEEYLSVVWHIHFDRVH